MTCYGLFLSDMREPNFEGSDRLVAWSPNKEDLERLLEQEKVEPYEDGRFKKVFRAGGPLEWYNNTRASIPRGEDYGAFIVLTLGPAPLIEEILSEDQYVQRAREAYAQLMAGAYRADTIEARAAPPEPLRLGGGDER